MQYYDDVSKAEKKINQTRKKPKTKPVVFNFYVKHMFGM